MIRIENLGFSYGKVPVLKNITMNLEAGKIYGLLGENGVGKTTLLTLLCGLKKTTEGSITVDGMRRLQENSGRTTARSAFWRLWNSSRTTLRKSSMPCPLDS